MRRLMVLAGLCLSATIVLKAQIAKDKCKFLGNIIAGYTPSDFKTYWDQVTPENGGKWGSVEATRDVMSWAQLDNAYNFAKTNGLPFKQHTFVWGQQQPTWISSLPLAEQKEEVEEWIKLFCERYPDTDFIDVVNEPLHAVHDYTVALGGGGSTGWDWVIWAFEKARQYCPNAKLILNDYNIISSDAATTQYIQLINLLKEENLIDIIGEQGHFMETTPISTVTTNLNRLKATGLPIHISEFDINIADDAQQQAKYQELFPVLWTNSAVQGITLWGYKQNEIWRTDAYLVRSNGTARPALTWLSNYVPSVSGGVFCNPVTGIDEDEYPVEVYPNPSRGDFSLSLRPGSYAIKLMDAHGAVTKEMEMKCDDHVVIPFRESSGLYVLQVFDGEKMVSRKVIVR